MMEYSLGKWLERIDAKLNVLLEVNGIDSETLSFTEPVDKTTDKAQEPEKQEEELDTEEPQANTREELQAKVDSIKKSMNKQGSKTKWQG